MNAAWIHGLKRIKSRDSNPVPRLIAADALPAGHFVGKLHRCYVPFLREGDIETEGSNRRGIIIKKNTDNNIFMILLLYCEDLTGGCIFQRSAA